MKFRLAVADVDGTLIDHSGEIPSELFTALDAFRREGGLFTLATGRPIDGARRFVKELDLDLPFIVFNGSVIYDYSREEVLREVSLPFELALTALRLSEHRDVDVFMYRGRDIYVSSITEPVEGYMAKDGIKCLPVGNLADYLQRERFNPPKLLFIGDTKESVRIMEELVELGFPDVNYVQSDASYIELLPPGSSKGEALEWLAAHLEIPMNKVLCIGDNHNDLQMIRRAGCGVAVANAQTVLRKEADLITSSPYGHGVAEALQQVLQGRI